MNPRRVTQCGRTKIVYATPEEAREKCDQITCVHYGYYQCEICGHCWYFGELAEDCCSNKATEEILVNPPQYMV